MSKMTIERLEEYARLMENTFPYKEILSLFERIRALEAERDAYKAQANLYEHMVITCGVAATHSDANLTRTGSYAEKWNSQQAEQVRALRAERDALRAERDALRKDATPNGWMEVPESLANGLYDACDRAVSKGYAWDGLAEIMAQIDADYAAIAAKEPK